mmetsp:Transcript_38919/g.79342  ORF Transcript_38919/g.79342 Transcript_38919/m.79342 type:complete len:279 (-) Transcript_38919:686-1522(-)
MRSLVPSSPSFSPLAAGHPQTSRHMGHVAMSCDTSSALDLLILAILGLGARGLVSMGGVPLPLHPHGRHSLPNQEGWFSATPYRLSFRRPSSTRSPRSGGGGGSSSVLPEWKFSMSEDDARPDVECRFISARGGSIALAKTAASPSSPSASFHSRLMIPTTSDRSRSSALWGSNPRLVRTSMSLCRLINIRSVESTGGGMSITRASDRVSPQGGAPNIASATTPRYMLRSPGSVPGIGRRDTVGFSIRSLISSNFLAALPGAMVPSRSCETMSSRSEA